MEIELKDLVLKIEKISSDVEEIKMHIRTLRSIVDILEVRMDERTKKIIGYLESK